MSKKDVIDEIIDVSFYCGGFYHILYIGGVVI